VDVLPAGAATPAAAAVASAWPVAAGDTPTDALAGAAVDATKLLDVDMDELART